MFRNGSMQICLQLLNDVRGTRKAQRRQMLQTEKKTWKGLIAIRHSLFVIVDLNGTVTMIVNVFSRFESLWIGMTHPHKFKDRVCTLLLKKISFMRSRIKILQQTRKTVRSSKNFICCFVGLYPIWSQLSIISCLVRVARRGTEIGLSMSNFYGIGGIYTSLSIER